MYMFLVGLELDLRDLRRLGRTTFVISQAGIFVPFLLGFVIGSWLHPDYAPFGVPALVFSLFVGISLSITAFPVLARILSDRGMTKTPIGTMALSAAAVEDARSKCGGSKCTVELSFYGEKCGAFAFSGNSWSLLQRDTLRGARSAALDTCGKNGKPCRIIDAVCANDPGRDTHQTE